MTKFNEADIDPGILETVLLLRKAGYKTFTSCEGGKGHPFREPTVGLNFKGDYFLFRDQLVSFLHSHGFHFFEVSLVSSYHETHPKGKHYVYLQGLDIASRERQRKILRAIQQKDRRLEQRLIRNGYGGFVEELRKEQDRLATEYAAKHGSKKRR